MVLCKVSQAGGVVRRILQVSHGGVILRVVVALSLIAIAVGVFFSVLERSVRVLTAFEEVGAGRIEGNRCTNDFFGFSIELPKGWYVASRENLKHNLDKQSKSDRRNAAFILLIFRFGPYIKKRDGFDAGLFVAAERLSNVPGVRTAREYVLRALEERKKEAYCGEPKGPFECVVGGRPFYGLDCKSLLRDTMVNTSHLVTIKKGYAFGIFAAWESEEDGRVLAETLKTVRFEQPSGPAEQRISP